jgi:hypothetical protein
MTRIEFTDTDSSNSYTVPYNPTAVTLHQNVVRDVVSDIASVPIIRTATVDNRIRTMVWGNFEAGDSSFNSMVTTLKSYVGRLKLLNLHDIDYNSLGAKTIQIINVRKVILNNQRSSTRYGLAVDFVFKESIITETLPAYTIESLKNAFLDLEPKNLQILNDDSDYITYDGTVTDRINRLIDLTGNGWHFDWKTGELSYGTIVTDSDIGNRNAMSVDNDSGVCTYKIGNNSYLAANYGFMADLSEGGCSIINMYKPINTPNQSVILGTDGSDTGNKTRSILESSSNRGFFTSGRQGGTSYVTDWQYLNNYWADETWNLEMFRTNFDTGNDIWEFQNGRGASKSANFATAIDVSANLRSNLRLFSGNGYNNGFNGYFAIQAIYPGMLTAANFDTIVEAVNNYYGTSFQNDFTD